MKGRAAAWKSGFCPFSGSTTPPQLEPWNAQRIGLGCVRLVNQPTPRRSRGEPPCVPGKARRLDVERAAILGNGVGQESHDGRTVDDHAERDQPLSEQQLPEPGGILRSHGLRRLLPGGSGR